MNIDNVSLSKSLPILRAGRASRAGAGATDSFLVDAKPDGITLISSNLVSETACSIIATDIKPATATMPAQFADIVEKSASVPIVLKMTEKRADLTIGSMKAKLPLKPGADFPRLTLGEVTSTHSLKAAQMAQALSETIQFAPLNDTRPMLNGVLLVLSKGRLVCVATNGHVMSVSMVAADIEPAGQSEHILPLPAARQLLKVLECSDEVQVQIGINALQFKCGTTELRLKPIQGKYPNWMALLKAKPAQTIAVPRVQLKNALERAAVFSEGKVRTATFDIGDSGITVSASSTSHGDFADIIAVDKAEAQVAKMFHANLEYMALSTANFSTDVIRLSYSTEAEGQVWFRKGDTDDCIVIVTPYRK